MAVLLILPFFGFFCKGERRSIIRVMSTPLKVIPGHCRGKWSGFYIGSLWTKTILVIIQTPTNLIYVALISEISI